MKMREKRITACAVSEVESSKDEFVTSFSKPISFIGMVSEASFLSTHQANRLAASNQ